MKIVLTLTMMFCLALVGAAAATQLVDAWNDTQEPTSGSIFAYPANYAIPYVPTQDYYLELVEFWAGASEYMANDQFTVQIQGDFTDLPDGNVLASAVHPLVDGEPAAFQGTAFPDPVFLIAGQTYWVVYFAMPFSPSSTAQDGIALLTLSSSDQIHWDPSNPAIWMARFWGEPTGVAVESRTLGEVKSLFR